MKTVFLGTECQDSILTDTYPDIFKISANSLHEGKNSDHARSYIHTVVLRKFQVF